MVEATPGWAVAPFPVYLLLLALLPLLCGRFWESNRNKLAVAVLAAVPVVAYLVGVRSGGGAELLHTGADYVAFVALLGGLYTITGGIHVRGSLVASTGLNLGILVMGAILASLIGTTGASVLLIRPLLRANQHRRYATHVVVFFIFIVSNGGGLLTPLGDPPLFLGFLRGVPFTWTLRLAAPWALVNGILLTLFVAIDGFFHLREEAPPARVVGGRVRVDGALNFVWLAWLLGAVFCVGTWGPILFDSEYQRTLAQVVGPLVLATLSFFTTRRAVHAANRFRWGPMVEVAVVFLGVFVTMAPVLSFLQEKGASLGLTQPWQFFWAAGALSSVLDNAPTYLTFASLARGVVEGGSVGTSLAGLAAHVTGQQLLAAVSCGAVFMGAMTYIGNGPNFMVKAIAEEHHIRMPTFFSYLLWSSTILLPIFGVVSRVFFR